MARVICNKLTTPAKLSGEKTTPAKNQHPKTT